MTARELDVVAADYVQQELRKREFEREKRDRDYWTVMFGGEVSDREPDDVVLDVPEHKPPGTLLGSEDDVIARSPLGQR
jgi:hypothetical protein